MERLLRAVQYDLVIIDELNHVMGNHDVPPELPTVRVCAWVSLPRCEAPSVEAHYCHRAHAALRQERVQHGGRMDYG